MRFRRFFPEFSYDLAIDLGTANSLVYLLDRGIIVNEPSVVAVDTMRGQIEAVGREALEMMGRTPAHITAVRPIKDGVIAHFDLTEEMLKRLLRKAQARRSLLGPRVIIGTPSEITPVERRALAQATRASGVRKMYLVDQPVAAALGAGLPITEPGGNMVVDIGAGTTDIAVISLSGIVYSRTLRVAGDEMDQSIVQYMKRKHNLLIGERTAERIKLVIGSAAPAESRTMQVKGRSLIREIPQTVTVTDEEIRETLSDLLSTIIEGVRMALEQTPPELCADIADRGILLTGGGALLQNLVEKVERAVGLPVRLAKQPLYSVVLGAARILREPGLLRVIAGLS